MKTSLSVASIILGLILVLSGASCSGYATRPDHMRSREYQAQPALASSSIAAEATTLTSKDIETLLGSKIVLPRKSRIAVATLVPGMPTFRLDDQVAKDFLGKVQASSRVRDIVVLPGLLLPPPGQLSLPAVRSAGARMQADLVLLVQSSEQDYRGYGFFSPDQSKSVANLEGILIDVRTGAVPFSAAVREDFSTLNESTDASFEETRDRARQAAFSSGMAKLGSDLSAFLKDAP